MVKITIVVAAVLVATVTSDDVLDALTCHFNGVNTCQWQADGWDSNCDEPQLCYIFTDKHDNVANLRSIKFNNSRPICLRIDYAFLKIGYSTLLMSVSGRTVFNTTNHAAPEGWQTRNVTIAAGSGQQVAIKATRDSGTYTTVYIRWLDAAKGAC